MAQVGGMGGDVVGPVSYTHLDVYKRQTLTTGQALKNLVKFTGESVERVLPLLTANPARLVGLSYRKGSIAPGKDADLVVLDEELNVRETYVAGRLVYAGECE